MDVIILTVVGVVLGLTAIVYLLATLSTKEVSFEDAIAEQRQKQEQERAQQKAERQLKRNKIKVKKSKKKELESGVPGSQTNLAAIDQEVCSQYLEPDTEPEPEVSAPEAEAEPEPEPEPEQEQEPDPEPESEITPPQSIEPEQEPSPKPVQEKRKDKKKKKEEKAAAAAAAAAERESSRKLVIEEIEAPVESAPDLTNEKVLVSLEAEVEEPILVEAQVQTVAAAAAPQIREKPLGAEKKKKDKKDKEKIKLGSLGCEINISQLLPIIQKVHLSGVEIQSFIEVLLNKQGGGGGNDGGEWVEKGRVDPTTLLRRQLEEAEEHHKEQQEAQTALSAKIADLRTELNTERSRTVQFKRQLEQANTNHQRQLENATISANEKQTAGLNELRKTLEQEFQIKLQELQQQQQELLQQQQQVVNNEEQQQQQAQLRAVLSESERRVKVVSQEHEDLTQRCQKYEEHINSLEEKHAAEEAGRTAKLKELQNQLAAADSARTQALSQVSLLASEKEQLALQVNQYSQDNSRELLSQAQSSLQEALREKSELESRLIQVDSELSSVHQVVHNQTTQIECLKEEKESLASQSVRPAVEGQENGDLRLTPSPTQAQDSAHLESLVKEKDSVIELKTSEVAVLKKEVSRLKEELDGQKEKNDGIKRVQEEEESRVRELLRRLCPNVDVDDALDQPSFVTDFGAKASEVPQPKPERVEVVIEKIVEKIIEDPKQTILVQELQGENSCLLSRIEELQKHHDDLLKDKNELIQHSETLLKEKTAALESAATAAAETAAAETAAIESSNEEVVKLEDENKLLIGRVCHYQNVLADTEALLKSLQTSVESEEIKWKGRLSAKEDTIRQVTAEKANLELEVNKTTKGDEEKLEMQFQIEAIKEKLNNAEQEKAALEEKLVKAEDELSVSAQGMGAGEGSSSDASSLDELQKENEKLRALVNVGQDSNRQQEELISRLQTELTSTKSASTNGPTSTEEQCPEGGGVKQ